MEERRQQLENKFNQSEKKIEEQKKKNAKGNKKKLMDNMLKQEDNNENHGVGNGDHLQVYNKKTGKSYGQRPDGSPSHGDKGDPPNIVKKKLKEKTGWDWDAKKEKRKKYVIDTARSNEYTRCRKEAFK